MENKDVSSANDFGLEVKLFDKSMIYKSEIIVVQMHLLGKLQLQHWPMMNGQRSRQVFVFFSQEDISRPLEHHLRYHFVEACRVTSNAKLYQRL